MSVPADPSDAESWGTDDEREALYAVLARFVSRPTARAIVSLALRRAAAAGAPTRSLPELVPFVAGGLRLFVPGADDHARCVEDLAAIGRVSFAPAAPGRRGR